MERLPPELLTHVCSSLSDIRSLKKLRLVNAKFAQIAAQSLFEGLCFAFIPRYLDKVGEVAFHPTLRFHVRTLYFDSDILNERFADYETWEAAIDTREQTATKGTLRTKAKDPETARWQCSQVDLDHAHANFKHLLASQKSLFNSGMDLELLSTALARLPNLRTIKSIERSYLEGAMATPYASIRGDEKNWVTIVSDLQVETLLPDLYLHCSLSTQPGIGQPLASLLSGLGLARKQIRTMELTDVPWEFWKHGVWPHIRAAFQDLESLDVSFMVDAYDLEVPLQGLLPSSIRTCIEAARGLRVLDVDFECYGAYDYEREDGFEDCLGWFFPRVGQLFATLTLPNLAIFRLSRCMLTGTTLIGFIRRHTATLKEISLSCVSLESSSWETVSKQIAPTLSLDSVTLEFLESDEIRKVVLEDTFDEAGRSRNAAYCEGLEHFLYHRGRAECPRIADFSPSGARGVHLSSGS